ncbi:MAG: GatB/YqeY domain-containing protein [Acidaminococcales bacterium]|jgi:uncharacterized protein YqeY|nr:GatB/YqeY domain-containing protein [Acidaminococcales bacterium]
MSLKTRLGEDMKDAMRERESGKFRLSVIRMVRAAIKYAEIEARRELGEEEVVSVLAKEVKMRRDSFAEFTKGNRPDLAQQAQREIDILLAYMPKQLTVDEVRSLVAEAVRETGAASPKDMGKVMAFLAPRIKGRADGKQVSGLVQETLGGK